ncbi:hypothetical protein [Flavobacterium lindanitolerans]|uniref:Uncharacterized protein n=1 Tax=Flavobacterium lindanitolerans TaxID=428988 RepID=A0A497UNW7_9FLAO|nr:hypothetical protein [Flavobacterium lindanitolerans]MBC8644266.1 hypothetical protein [Flavobacterium lindanitolerans]PKW21174.1 hypothetical protein B0G92_2458 [Flavobacterium lindanitolerans]RLJ30188.1 hypothetical protein CLV50_1592 [Flavobacterium lindanitolerans]
MKSSLLVLLSILFIQATTSKRKEVYICNSPNGKRFHYTESCEGLQNCTYKIEKITLREAQKAGKTRCGYER